jgi:hypothetical protein
MPRVGLEPTTLVFERAKTVHALERAVTVSGLTFYIAMLRVCTIWFNFEQGNIWVTDFAYILYES